jgi:hypothetical protein
MRADIQKGLVVDNNNGRGRSILESLIAQRVDAEHLIDVKVINENGGCVGSNFDMDTDLNGIDLLFIHLGYPESDRATYPGGNLGSLECLLHYKNVLEKTCVVAYTGGTRQPHDDFLRFRRHEWHAHFCCVQKDIAFNIPALVRAWRRQPDQPPPLAMLSSPLWAPEFFNLIGACQGDARPTFAQWQAVLGSDELYRQLLDELAGPQGQQLHYIARRIKAVLQERQCDPAAPLTFDDDLRRDILTANPWPFA